MDTIQNKRNAVAKTFGFFSIFFTFLTPFVPGYAKGLYGENRGIPVFLGSDPCIFAENFNYRRILSCVSEILGQGCHVEKQRLLDRHGAHWIKKRGQEGCGGIAKIGIPAESLARAGGLGLPGRGESVCGSGDHPGGEALRQRQP
jgi:hypothetical protein